MRRHPNNNYQIGDVVRLIPGQHPITAHQHVVDHYDAASLGSVCNINGKGVLVKLEDGGFLWCRYYAIEPAESAELDFDGSDLYALMGVTV